MFYAQKNKEISHTTVVSIRLHLVSQIPACWTPFQLGHWGWRSKSTKASKCLLLPLVNTFFQYLYALCFSKFPSVAHIVFLLITFLCKFYLHLTCSCQLPVFHILHLMSDAHNFVPTMLNRIFIVVSVISAKYQENLLEERFCQFLESLQKHAYFMNAYQ